MITKKANEDFKSSIKCWIYDNTHVDDDVKVRYYCHMTRNYRGSTYRDCNINVILSHKLPIVFRNLENYDSHLIMEKLGKFSLKMNVLPNGLRKFMSFNINSKLIFIDSFQF